MVIKLKNKNPIIKNLYSKKYKPRIVKSKKGKGSFKRLKNIKD
jgi:alternative ribosome-rescue factor|tara:strand:+ start:956 stop:1084 length:129 start_codon:yes stop_codon:yes gene_type:complete